MLTLNTLLVALSHTAYTVVERPKQERTLFFKSTNQSNTWIAVKFEDNTFSQIQDVEYIDNDCWDNDTLLARYDDDFDTISFLEKLYKCQLKTCNSLRERCEEIKARLQSK